MPLNDGNQVYMLETCCPCKMLRVMKMGALR